MEALLLLSFRQLFLEILNQVFILKKHQKKFGKCEQSTGCVPLWRANWFEQGEQPSPMDLRCYQMGGCCKNCIVIEDLACLWFFDDFCKMRSGSIRLTVTQFARKKKFSLWMKEQLFTQLIQPVN